MLTPDDPIEEGDLSVRSYDLLKRLGCDTFGDVARLGWRHVLYHPSGRRWVLDEINDKLASVGLGIPPKTRTPERLRRQGAQGWCPQCP